MPPLLRSLLAQDTARETLERALSAGRVHHAYLFDGPDGVGKERAAVGLAQALLCERRAPHGNEACGACPSCVRVATRKDGGRPVHPDVVFLERGLYAPEQIGRRTPETQDLSIDQVRTLVLSRAAFGPHEGRARVYIIRRVEELSTGAANALLKTLEEPGDKTYFVLLSSSAESLLATIRSRTQRVRFGRLPDEVVERLLVASGHEAGPARDVSKLAEGSMAEASILADHDAAAAREAFVESVLSALDARSLSGVLAVAEAAKKQKDGLDLHLRALGRRLADRSRREVAKGLSGERGAEQHGHLLAALRQLDGNASAQLVVESMLMRMRHS